MDASDPIKPLEKAPLRVGVLFSGAGTNLNAILEACERHTIDAEVCVAITNRPQAGGIELAKKRGVPLVICPRPDFESRAAQQGAIGDALESNQTQLVVLAGFDQILNADGRFAAGGLYENRIINLHPSLLPAFPGGLRAIHDAWEWGAKVTGVTVHIANDELDAGPIILQEAVPVEEADTEESLAARIHAAEHRLLPAAIQLFAQDRLRIEARRVHILPPGQGTA